MRRAMILITSFLGGASPLRGADHPIGRPVRKFCYLPSYSYTKQEISNPQLRTSTAALLLSPIPATLTQSMLTTPMDASPRIKAFQMTGVPLSVGHCQLSQVAVCISDNGQWIVNCEATQDPMLVDTVHRPPFWREKRNQFNIAVTGVALAQVEEQPASRTLGQPQLIKLCMDPFLVEQSQTVCKRWTGCSESVRTQFPFIQRIDVELRYE